jgi:hypothetical protein
LTERLNARRLARDADERCWGPLVSLPEALKPVHGITITADKPRRTTHSTDIWLTKGSNMSSNSLKARATRGQDIFASTPKKKAAVAKEAAPSVQVGAYGRYQVKSGRLNGEYIARAFPTPPARTRGLIAEAFGATEEAAITALHEALDAREVSRTGDRRTNANTGHIVPSVEEYAEAIRQIDLSNSQRALLDALAFAQDKGLSEAQMARAAGYKSRASVRRSFAGVGLLIREFLSIDAPEGSDPEDLDGSSLVGYHAHSNSDEAPASWVLNEELREALLPLRA